MQRFQYILLFSIFISLDGACQCFSFSNFNQDFYHTYDDRYKDNQTIRLFPCAELINQNVKSLKIYTVTNVSSRFKNSDSLRFSVTFDKSGKILQKGFFNNYYFVLSDTFRNNDSVKMIVTKYTNHQATERIDSIWFNHFFYNKKGDYTISFILKELKTYKSGKHINERNAFFNQELLSSKKKRKAICKTNYSENEMCLCSDIYDIERFSAYNDFKDAYGHLKTLKNHPFVRSYANKVFNPKYFIDGEKLSRLSWTNQNPSGGNIENSNIEYVKQDSVSKNNKGLDDTVFRITSKILKNPGESPRVISTSIDPLFTIRYEYYKD